LLCWRSEVLELDVVCRDHIEIRRTQLVGLPLGVCDLQCPAGCGRDDAAGKLD